MKEPENSVVDWLIKCGLPWLAVAVIITSFKIHKKEAKGINIFLSLLISFSTVYLTGDLVYFYFSQKWAAILIAMITVFSEKFWSWILYKAKIDDLLSSILEAIKARIIKFINK
jgi:biotin transporter BioY